MIAVAVNVSPLTVHSKVPRAGTTGEGPPSTPPSLVRALELHDAAKTVSSSGAIARDRSGTAAMIKDGDQGRQREQRHRS